MIRVVRLVGVAVGAGVGLVVLIAIAVGAAVLVLSSANRTSWTDLEVGDCIDLASSFEGIDDPDTLFVVDIVSCSDAEVGTVAEVVTVGDMNPDGPTPYPSDGALTEMIDARCAASASDRERFGLLPILPDERTWADRRGRYVCLAIRVGG